MHPIVWFVIIWAITIIMTCWMLVYVACNMVTEFANHGLLINVNKLPHADSNIVKTLIFIPIINVIMGFIVGLRYNQTLSQLAATSSVFTDPMTEDQKKRWEKNPKAMTAFELIAENEKQATKKTENKPSSEKADRMLNELDSELDDDPNGIKLAALKQLCATKTTEDLKILYEYCEDRDHSVLLNVIKEELDRRENNE